MALNVDPSIPSYDRFLVKPTATETVLQIKKQIQGIDKLNEAWSVYYKDKVEALIASGRAKDSLQGVAAQVELRQRETVQESMRTNAKMDLAIADMFKADAENARIIQA